MEHKYRLKQYEQSGDFYMTANEKWFHLIGFIDAIVSFQRGNLFKNPETLKQELTETYFGDGEPLTKTLAIIRMAWWGLTRKWDCLATVTYASGAGKNGRNKA